MPAMYSNKPQPLNKFLSKDFKPETMGTGYKRGFVLVIYKSKCAEACGKQVASFIDSAELKGKDDNPDLHIKCTNHLAKHELNSNRERIKTLINGRMKSEFVNKIVLR